MLTRSVAYINIDRGLCGGPDHVHVAVTVTS